MVFSISIGSPQVSVGQNSQKSLGFLNQAAQSSAQTRNLVNQANEGNQRMLAGLRVNNPSQEDLGIASRLTSAATGLTGIMTTRSPGQSRISDPGDGGDIMAAQQRMFSNMQTGNSLALNSAASQGRILNLIG